MSTETIRVHATASVLGLRPGEEADLPLTTFELQACIDRGLVIAMDGTELLPLYPTANPCGCGKRG